MTRRRITGRPKINRPVHPGLASARKRDGENAQNTHRAAEQHASAGISDALKAGVSELSKTLKAAMESEDGVAESRGSADIPRGDGKPGFKADFGIRVQFGLGGKNAGNGGGGGGGGGHGPGPQKPDTPGPSHSAPVDQPQFLLEDKGDHLKISPLDGISRLDEHEFVMMEDEGRLEIQDRETGDVLQSFEMPYGIDAENSGIEDDGDAQSVLLKRHDK